VSYISHHTVEVLEPAVVDKKLTIGDLCNGQFGIRHGKIIFRRDGYYTYLESDGQWLDMTYSDCRIEKILPPGTKIVITVGF
jgi:hypothetical protein